MTNNKDIQRLIDLFMAGQTSLDEEQQLSDYFRTHDVPQEWKAYKEMFGYFDDGMPEGRYDGKTNRNIAKWRTVWASLAAAAAVAALFVMTWKGGNGDIKQLQQDSQMASLSVDTATVDSIDSTFQQMEKPVTTTKKRKTSKYKYRIAPPKTYYAAVKNSASNSVEDSIKRTELLLAADIKNAELVEQLLLRKMELMEMAHNMEIALAADETVDEGEIAEEVY